MCATLCGGLGVLLNRPGVDSITHWLQIHLTPFFLLTRSASAKILFRIQFFTKNKAHKRQWHRWGGNQLKPQLRKRREIAIFKRNQCENRFLCMCFLVSGFQVGFYVFAEMKAFASVVPQCQPQLMLHPPPIGVPPCKRFPIITIFEWHNHHLHLRGWQI